MSTDVLVSYMLAIDKLQMLLLVVFVQTEISFNFRLVLKKLYTLAHDSILKTLVTF